MQKALTSLASISLASFGFATAANAHGAAQVRSELRQDGYYQIQFIEDEAPFQVNACRGGQRYHLHIDWYGRVTERSPIGECRERRWSQASRHSYNRYDR